MGTEHVGIAIIGGGFGGLGMAIQLRKQRQAQRPGAVAQPDFVVLERAHDVGGTWRDNSYPGCACDVPSHLYSFSFAPNPGWSRSFSPQPEILAYLRDCAHRSGVLDHVRFGTELRDAAWDAGRRVWRITTNSGELTADALVAGTGPLCEPSVPDLPGLDGFAGRAFHSARWDHDHDLTGRRVAVIGTGASAIQFIPRIAPTVAALHVFQRTPPWVIPRRDRALTDLERRLYRAAPPLQRLSRMAIYATRESALVNFQHPGIARVARHLALRHLRKSVADPALRRRLTPLYTMGCKRVLLSDDYYPALARHNVEVVSEGVREVRPDAVVTSGGVVREVDTIIFGTGFHVTDVPIAQRVRGSDGRTLAEVWRGSPKAYLGTMVAGFPNLFLLLGPNTGLGHNSVVLMLEAQFAHVLDALRYLRTRGAAALAPRQEVQDAYQIELDARLAGTVWNSGGCTSWYLDATGRNSTLWPGSTWAFRRRLAHLRPADYELVAPAGAPVEVAQ